MGIEKEAVACIGYKYLIRKGRKLNREETSALQKRELKGDSKHIKSFSIMLVTRKI